MRLFRKSDSHSLEAAWSYSVEGAIWRIYPTAAGTLVGEERRINNKKTFFFCLDRKNGHELWQHASPGDEWWIGIEAVDRDTVFFHGFATPNLPLHRGIIAADMLTGKKLWEDQELEFVGTRDEFVVGSKEASEGRSFIELDRRSGARAREVDAAELRALGVKRAGSDIDVRLPVPIEQDAIEKTPAGTAIQNHLGRTLAGPVEIVEMEKFLVFDYHEVSEHGTSESPLFSSTIKIVDREAGAVIYSDAVSAGVKAIIPELFLVQHDMLYYIKDRRTLTAVHLAS